MQFTSLLLRLQDLQHKSALLLAMSADWSHHARDSVKFSDTSLSLEDDQGIFTVFFLVFPPWIWGRWAIISCRDLIHWVDISDDTYGLCKSDQPSLQAMHRSGHFHLNPDATTTRAAPASYFLQKIFHFPGESAGDGACLFNGQLWDNDSMAGSPRCEPQSVVMWST